MIFNKERLNLLENEMIDNNIDKEDVIRFITSYSLQSKVTDTEFNIIVDCVKRLMDTDTPDINSEETNETPIDSNSKKIMERFKRLYLKYRDMVPEGFTNSIMELTVSFAMLTGYDLDVPEDSTFLLNRAYAQIDNIKNGLDFIQQFYRSKEESEQNKK